MLPALVPLFPFRTEEEPTLSPSEKGGKGEIITKIAQWWGYLSDFFDFRAKFYISYCVKLNPYPRPTVASERIVPKAIIIGVVIKVKPVEG